MPHKSDAPLIPTFHAPQFQHQRAHRPGRKEQPSRRQKHGTPSAAALAFKTSNVPSHESRPRWGLQLVPRCGWKLTNDRTAGLPVSVALRSVKVPPRSKAAGTPPSGRSTLTEPVLTQLPTCRQCVWFALPPYPLCVLTISLIGIGPCLVPRSISGSVRRAVAFGVFGALGL